MIRHLRGAGPQLAFQRDQTFDYAKACSLKGVQDANIGIRVSAGYKTYSVSRGLGKRARDRGADVRAPVDLQVCCRDSE
jgi:hypothetical protein